MSSEKWTPTISEARGYFLDGYTGVGAGGVDESDAEFDRFVAKIKADALREAADAADVDPDFRDPLRLKSDWLRHRADRIEEEA